jgi:hypothetical protein
MDKNLSSVIKFLDDTASISDAEISNIAKQLKFSEVLDLVGFVGKGDTAAAKTIVAKYDDRFISQPAEPTEEAITNEYSNVPTAAKTTSMFKPVAPKKPTSPTMTGTADAGESGELEAELDQAQRSGKGAEVNQIRSLLQRISNR